MKKEVILTIEQIFHAKSNFSVVEKLHQLEFLKNALQDKLRKIEKAKAMNAMRKKYRDLGQALVLEKTEGEMGQEEYEFVELVDL